MRNIFLCGLVIVLFMISCKSGQSQSESASEVIFRVETQACMGPCPVFKFELAKDSTIVFKGIQHTDVVGEYSAKLDEDGYAKFLTTINQLDWESLEDSYKSELTDLPTQKYYFNLNSEGKSIYQYGSDPKDLYKVSKDILSLCESRFKD